MGSDLPLLDGIDSQPYLLKSLRGGPAGLDVIVKPNYDQDEAYLVARSSNNANCGYYSSLSLPPTPFNTPVSKELLMYQTLYGIEFRGIHPDTNTSRGYFHQLTISNYS